MLVCSGWVTDRLGIPKIVITLNVKKFVLKGKHSYWSVWLTSKMLMKHIAGRFCMVSPNLLLSPLQSIILAQGRPKE